MKKYLIITILFFGCNTAQRQLTKTQEYLFKHPEFTAGVCAEKFPDKPDSIIVKTDTIINIATMDSIVYDSIYLNNPMLIDTLSGKLFRRIVKTQKIYIRKDSIIYRGPNLAEEKKLGLALAKCQDNNNSIIKKLDEKDKLIAEWKAKAKTRWWWIALLIGGFVGMIAIKLFGKTKLPI